MSNLGRKIISSKLTGWIVAGGLSLILMAELRGCGKKQYTKDQIPPSVSDTVYVPKVSKSGNITPKPDTLILIDTLWGNVDTMNILKDYFATRKYLDTLIMENGEIIIDEHISENKIKHRGITLKTEDKIIEHSSFLFEVPRNKFFIGASIQLQGQRIANSFSVDGVMIPKSDKAAYMVGYDVLNGSIRAGALIKIGLRKEKKFETRP